eukprot:9034090-Alexandrium_andersonii.AAC.1
MATSPPSYCLAVRCNHKAGYSQSHSPIAITGAIRSAAPESSGELRRASESSEKPSESVWRDSESLQRASGELRRSTGE